MSLVDHLAFIEDAKATVVEEYRISLSPEVGYLAGHQKRCDDRKARVEWLNEKGIKYVFSDDSKIENHLSIHEVIWYFENIEDAMHFKLMFCGSD